ncbi:hypothetical protein [Pedobacter planticolens]|nr:hypothetical protein [Pedobacter planticolens]
MKNKAKLAFEMLEMEMELIEKNELKNFNGGDGPITWGSGGWLTNELSIAFGKPVTSGVDADGNWMIKIGDGAPKPLTINLDEVTITPNGGMKKQNGEAINGWSDILPPAPPNYGGGSNPNPPTGSGIIPPPIEEEPWLNVNWDNFYDSVVNNFSPSGEYYPPGDNEYLTGYNSAGYNSAGYNSAGYNSAGFNTSGMDKEFVALMDATGKTADAFDGVMQSVEGIAKMGDFAKEATQLLKDFQKYSGAIGSALGLITDFIEIYQDGQITRSELITFLTDQVVGRALGAVPLAGGIIATLYDVTGADDWVGEQITNLVDEYFPEPVTTP